MYSWVYAKKNQIRSREPKYFFLWSNNVEASFYLQVNHLSNKQFNKKLRRDY